MSLFRSGREEEAISYLNEAIEENPKNEYYWSTVGTMEGKLGNEETAEKFFTEALRLKPNSVATLNVTPCFYIHLGMTGLLIDRPGPP